jgi:outer membrane protein OmpA-like peptidoglycan-associated protein
MVRIFSTIGLLCLAALLCPLDLADAQEEPSAAQIRDALRPKAEAAPTTRKLRVRQGSAGSADDADFIEGLRNRQTRLITIEERTKAAEIAKARPSIDLEVTFDYDSDVIGPRAARTLVNLGSALRSGDLEGRIFLVSGHTDAEGGAGYNQALSERRAEAVKRFLAENFGIEPANLVAIGYGETQLKNWADPTASENRRVQIVNTEIKSAGHP